MRMLRALFVACAVSGLIQSICYGDEKVGSVKKCVALTFDDGPDKTLMPKLLSALREAKVHATFYLVGSRVRRWPDVVREIQRDGHEIGSHSWNHPNLTKLSPKALVWQIEMTDRVLKNITGTVPPTIRPPYGAMNKMMLQLVKRQFVLWDVDTRDWSPRQSSLIKKVILSKVHDGSIILLHDTHSTTVAEAPDIIRELQKLDYSFVTVSELFRNCNTKGPA